MIELLGTLLGGIDKVKLMRLFLANPDYIFTEGEVVARSQIKIKNAKRELKNLLKIGFIKDRKFWTGEKANRKRANGLQLNPDFQLLQSVKHLLFNTEPFTKKQIVERFKGTGQLKLIIVSGVFMKLEERRADLLIVGDALRKKVIENVIRTMEAEIGHELTYSIFETEEYKYRLGMYDKLIRDILDYPHDVVVDKLVV
ncbi:MAG: hypothetical protein WC764_03165 [Candidatus Paceibacterota bacterium]|jgi:hypothetical protein